MERNKPQTQQYDQYTQEDFTVWQTLFERQMILLKQHASHTYLQALETIGFHAGEIPDFNKVNETLSGLTGWQLTVVPELVPQQHFFELLSQKIFPATCWLRTFEELDYIEEPDMFHDVFGHVPLLANPAYASFMQSFGQLALEWIDDEEMIAILSRIYWFTIEFGLIKEGSEHKVYGAGILSSPGETRHSMDTDTTTITFDVDTILQTAYRTDVIQEQYFVIDKLEQLDQMLPEVRSLLHKKGDHFKLSAPAEKTIIYEP
ncbi:phenylalanine 4-monooxygenase [Taibaiella sp. KBW10]|uniref:phenylalanine 4-monooxygenase n=1 Tax=Taibaiella sp. KBW10 TaxID=2153357 RepID=UPI000F5A264E|nr:phenylalanine 4-monooxygenase [Taibaiella sp. KBW10]RQO29812.1 phenylalanine 4-monooxygenase [Taibaiella sp. KBW10]